MLYKPKQVSFDTATIAIPKINDDTIEHTFEHQTFFHIVALF